MAQHRERQLVGVHAGAVVGHLDAVDAAAVERDGDAGGAGVERVLDQLLHRRRGPLDHLAGGDAVDRRLRQQADARLRWAEFTGSRRSRGIGAPLSGERYYRAGLLDDRSRP